MILQHDVTSCRGGPRYEFLSRCNYMQSQAFTSHLNCFQYYYFSIFDPRNSFEMNNVRPTSLSRWQRFSFLLVFLALAVRAFIWLLICARHYYGRSRSIEFPKMKVLPIDNDQNLYTFLFLDFQGTYRERWFTVKEAKGFSNRTGNNVVRFINVPNCSANDGSYHTFWVVGADGNFMEKWLTVEEATALAKEQLLQVIDGDRADRFARGADTSVKSRPGKKSSLAQATRQPVGPPSSPSTRPNPPGRDDVPSYRIVPRLQPDPPVFDPVLQTFLLAYHFKKNVCVCKTSWISAEKIYLGNIWRTVFIMIRACHCGTKSLFKVNYRDARG